MKRSRAALTMAIVTILIGVIFAAVPVHGQQAGRAAGKRWTAPRTPDGQPDIQGRYTHEGFGTGKEDRPAVLCPDVGKGGNTCYENAWLTEPKGKLTVKLPMDVIDPPDGRLPLQPWAVQKKEEYNGAKASIFSLTFAEVAELVDAHDSGSCGGHLVEVRVVSSAFSKSKT